MRFKLWFNNLHYIHMYTYSVGMKRTIEIDDDCKFCRIKSFENYKKKKLQNIFIQFE